MNLPERVRWKDWAKVKAKYGLRMVDVIQENGDTVMIVEPIYPGLLDQEEEEEPMQIEPVDSKLGQMLADLLTQAQEEAGKPKRIRLKHGLQVDAIFGLDGMVRVQISRKGGPPSRTEWKTTCKHLPFEAGNPDPEEFVHKGFYYLRGEWPWR